MTISELLKKRMDKYLSANRYIDCDNPEIINKAQELAIGSGNDEDIAKACFRFVCDNIKHSNDYGFNPTTVKASDVLTHGTGWCYAKSHLLAALLRANEIPAGLCYQRLTIQNDTPPFCLHGLNAVFLENHGWYRVDARGNKPGVDADFCPPLEKLAFPIIVEGECDFLEIWPEPIPIVVDVLEKCQTYSEVLRNLPDIEIVKRINIV